MTATTVSRTNRIPYVGEGRDGCLRSAQIDREEADLCGPDQIAARERLLASAREWEHQASTVVWRRLLDRAFRSEDEDWHIGQGGDWLIELLMALMQGSGRGPGDPRPVTDGQLEWALDRIEDWS